MTLMSDSQTIASSENSTNACISNTEKIDVCLLNVLDESIPHASSSRAYDDVVRSAVVHRRSLILGNWHAQRDCAAEPNVIVFGFAGSVLLRWGNRSIRYAEQSSHDAH